MSNSSKRLVGDRPIFFVGKDRLLEGPARDFLLKLDQKYIGILPCWDHPPSINTPGENAAAGRNGFRLI
jgi:hypothetical protein